MSGHLPLPRPTKNQVRSAAMSLLRQINPRLDPVALRRQTEKLVRIHWPRVKAEWKAQKQQ